MQRYLFTREGDIALVDTIRPTRVFTPEGQSIIAAVRLQNDPGLIDVVRQRDYKKVDRILSSAKIKPRNRLYCSGNENGRIEGRS